MKLSALLSGVEYSCDNFVDVEIFGLSHNSKEVFDGYVFFALSDGNVDGRAFVGEAVMGGAKVVVLSSDGVIGFEKSEFDDVVFLSVEDVRYVMSVFARNFFGRADEQLRLVGVVGSNGKTTTSTIIYNIMCTAGYKTAIVGTNGVEYLGNRVETGMTTPDPIVLHKLLREMVDAGVECVVMEVSAHAIFYQKVVGIKFDVGVFTNISNEHLDFFKTMQNYSRIKKSFFTANFVKECVVNIDDDLGMKIAYDTDVPCVSYGLTRPANIFALDVKMTLDDMSFVINAFDDILSINTRLIGDYNVYNIMASIGACRLMNVDDECIIKTLNTMKNVDGRWHIFNLINDKKIIIDFAHTPDGFEKVLSLIKNLRTGKITTIFGCVGYSDRTKRKLMGEIASKFSDEIVITTDNICEENFNVVVKDILENVECKYKIIEERTMAIKHCFDNMIDGETLVVLGKGNEKYQKIKGKLLPYSDIETVKKMSLE